MTIIFKTIWCKRNGTELLKEETRFIDQIFYFFNDGLMWGNNTSEFVSHWKMSQLFLHDYSEDQIKKMIK